MNDDDPRIALLKELVDPLRLRVIDRLGHGGPATVSRLAADLDGLSEATVRQLAERLADGPPQALAAAKRSVNFAVGSTFEEALDFEFLLQGVQMQGGDFREGVTAFIEKRKPNFGAV